MDYGVISLDGTPRYFDRVNFSVKIERKYLGPVFRLGVPSLLLTLLVGLSFYSQRESRVELSVTILLAVSALYIIIQQNIPFLGYLTKFDHVFFGYFVMIIILTFIHQIINVLALKSDKDISKFILVVFIESVCRIFVIPIILLIFALTLETEDSSQNIFTLTLMTIYVTVMGIKEGHNFYKKFYASLIVLKDKVRNRKDNTSVEGGEFLLFNLIVFKSLSWLPMWPLEEDEQHSNISELEMKKNEKQVVSNPIVVDEL